MNRKYKLPYKVSCIAYVATSIDGKIAKNSQSDTDWTSKEDWNFFQKSLSKMDAVVVGRNTYQLAKARLDQRNAIVLSSKVNSPKLRGKTTFLNPDKTDLKKFLQTKDYRNVAIAGGAKVYDYCLRHKILDELYVTIEPYVFTAGVPMFSGSEFKKHRFTLMSVKRLNKKGTILLKYKNES